MSGTDKSETKTNL